MRITGRGLLAAVALAWTAFGLFWALLILLPAPSLVLWAFAVLVAEFSLLLAGFALSGLGLAALAWRAGARRAPIFAAAFGVVTVAISLVPVAQARQTANAEGVPPSLSEYFAGPSFISDRSPSETRVYARPEGEELTLDVWEPPEEAGRKDLRPAVVMVHGGSWEMGERSFPRWPSWLADRGYVVFDIGYRLAPPPRWQDAPGDVKCAVGWVKENAARYGVDPDRVALMGDSAGGHLALLAAYTEGNPDLPPGCRAPDTGVAAVVALYPPTDLARFCAEGLPRWYPDLDCEGVLRRFTGGTPSTVPGRYRVVSPISHVDPGDPPTFVVQGGRDSLVPPEQSALLAERLRAAGVPHRLLRIPYAQHAFDLSWGGWGSQITRPNLDRFLARHLVARRETPGLQNRR